ncbi:MAG TPA: GntR family transcriptional regulator, partial [Propionibacteriaceae bacterium]|nr:GntR family transcriptional regulator [Propionibacteriaceae bacterium]
MTTAPALNGLTKINLREQALASVRTAITTGQLPPGTQMVETDLSEQLGISRGTLREAMRQLQQEGLLVAGGRGRLYVRRLGPKEIADLFVVRASLEGLAASILAREDDREDAIGRLRGLLDAMNRAVNEQHLERRIEADLAFHHELCRLTSNETLLHSWEGLEGSIRMSIMYAGTDRAIGNMDVRRHDVIVAAIRSGDAEAAHAAV